MAAVVSTSPLTINVQDVVHPQCPNYAQPILKFGEGTVAHGCVGLHTPSE